jgi:hypothetical protein
VELDGLIDLGGPLKPECAAELQQTLLLACRDGSPSSVEAALIQFADSIERLVGADSTTAADPYRRGLVTGLRAAAKVAANVKRH